MLKRIALAAITCAVLIPATAVAAHSDKAKTTVHFDTYTPGDPIIPGTFSKDAFDGRVESNKTSCLKHRKVVLYMKKGHKTKKIGSDTPADIGSASDWRITDKNTKAGKYYASTKATKGCKADKSPTFNLHDPNVQQLSGHRAAPSARAHGHKTKTTLQAPQYATSSATKFSNGNFFAGVSSNKKACIDKRKVTVYLKKHGKDKKIGSGKAQLLEGRTGRVAMTYTAEIRSKHTKSGDYYSTTKSTSKCGGDRSDVATVSIPH